MDCLKTESLGGTIIAFVIFDQRKKTYVNHFKKTVIGRIIHFIDPQFQYSPALHVSEKDYLKSGLYLEDPDNFRGDDYVEGVRDKTHFCFSEVHTEHEVQNGKNTTTETIFKGLFFVGDFNKNFHGRTYVWNEVNPQLGFFGKVFSSFARNLEKINLESIEFEQRFIVYSTDQVEARYILTPSFMERMVKLELMMGPGLSMSFVDTNIYVAIPIQNKLFEPALWKPNNYNSLGDYYNTVHIVFDIIDELKLNMRIWNKE